VGYLVDADPEFGVDMPDADFGVPPRHDVRVDTDTNRNAGVALSELLQDLDIVDVDPYALSHGLTDLAQAYAVGRKQDIVRVEARQQTQFHFLDGYSIQPAVSALHA